MWRRPVKACKVQSRACNPLKELRGRREGARRLEGQSGTTLGWGVMDAVKLVQILVSGLQCRFGAGSTVRVNGARSGPPKCVAVNGSWSPIKK